MLASVAALGGCQTVAGVLGGQGPDYRNTGRLPPLEVPPDLARPTADTRFNVPDVGGASATFSEFDKLRKGKPTASGAAGVLPQVDKTRIERAGNERWLVVPGAPEAIWPLLREFWLEAGFLIAIEIPEAGVMETDWSENRPRVVEGGIRGLFDKLLSTVRTTSSRDRFRTRLERGAGGTTEIYVSHRGMEEVQVGTNSPEFKWQLRPSDNDLEAEMLRRIMVRFGAPESVAKASVAQSLAPAAARARIVKDAAGGASLAVADDFDRAWRRVGLALDRVGFTVEDRDRSKGLYFVRYVDTDAAPQKEGYLSRLAFWRGDAVVPRKAEQFRILVGNAEGGSRVQVLNRDGGSDRSETAQRILTVLLDQLR
ncbi:MAG: outer membrane protein assembly factor BamC [Burkholderiales bacterium]|nr:outer membrane protein assembly factor BamC [Burkholderiales bacterium]